MRILPIFIVVKHFRKCSAPELSKIFETDSQHKQNTPGHGAEFFAKSVLVIKACSQNARGQFCKVYIYYFKVFVKLQKAEKVMVDWKNATNR